MKHVSLNKIKPSALIKVPGLLILGLLAVAFLLFPFAAFAGCGGGKQKAQPVAANVTNIEPLFGPNCGGSAAAQKNATVSTKPQPSTAQSPADGSPSQAAPVASNLLSAIAKCKFVVVKPGQQTLLENGDIVLGQTVKGQTDFIGIVIGGKVNFITQHATGENKKADIALKNASVDTGKPDKGSNAVGDSTPND